MVRLKAALAGALILALSPACASKSATSAPTTTKAPRITTTTALQPLTTPAPTKANLSVAQKAQVQSILTGAVDHYASAFATGESLNKKASSDPNAPVSQFPAWRQSSMVEGDVRTYETPFSKVNGFYNASNEPDAVSIWRDDLGTLQGDIALWVHAAVSWQIDNATDQQLSAAATTVTADIAKAKQDISAVLAAS